MHLYALTDGSREFRQLSLYRIRHRWWSRLAVPTNLLSIADKVIE
jgi:hypothetical protein